MRKLSCSVVALAILLLGLTACSSNGVHSTDKIKPTSITPETFVGVGAYLNYADEDFIIFQGDFGLFGYDLAEKRITFAMDLLGTIGAAGSQGTENCAAVRVTPDGTLAQVYAADGTSEVYYINTHEGTYYIAPYEELEARFDPNTLVGSGMDLTGITNPLDTGVGVKLGELCFWRDGEEWMVFADYFD